MESLSEQLSDVILREQTDFDLIYGRVDATKDVGGGHFRCFLTTGI